MSTVWNATMLAVSCLLLTTSPMLPEPGQYSSPACRSRSSPSSRPCSSSSGRGAGDFPGRTLCLVLTGLVGFLSAAVCWGEGGGHGYQGTITTACTQACSTEGTTIHDHMITHITKRLSLVEGGNPLCFSYCKRQKPGGSLGTRLPWQL